MLRNSRRSNVLLDYYVMEVAQLLLCRKGEERIEFMNHHCSDLKSPQIYPFFLFIPFFSILYLFTFPFFLFFLFFLCYFVYDASITCHCLSSRFRDVMLNQRENASGLTGQSRNRIERRGTIRAGLYRGRVGTEKKIAGGWPLFF